MNQYIPQMNSYHDTVKPPYADIPQMNSYHDTVNPPCADIPQMNSYHDTLKPPYANIPQMNPYHDTVKPPYANIPQMNTYHDTVKPPYANIPQMNPYHDTVKPSDTDIPIETVIALNRWPLKVTVKDRSDGIGIVYISTVMKIDYDTVTSKSMLTFLGVAFCVFHKTRIKKCPVCLHSCNQSPENYYFPIALEIYKVLPI